MVNVLVEIPWAEVPSYPKIHKKKNWPQLNKQSLNMRAHHFPRNYLRLNCEMKKPFTLWIKRSGLLTNWSIRRCSHSRTHTRIQHIALCCYVFLIRLSDLDKNIMPHRFSEAHENIFSHMMEYYENIMMTSRRRKPMVRDNDVELTYF